MNSVHTNYQGHFSSQFIYTMNEIDKDEDYYDANNDDSTTDNDNNHTSPLYIAPSAFPLLPDQTASLDTAYIEHMDIDQDDNNYPSPSHA